MRTSSNTSLPPSNHSSTFALNMAAEKADQRASDGSQLTLVRTRTNNSNSSPSPTSPTGSKRLSTNSTSSLGFASALSHSEPAAFSSPSSRSLGLAEKRGTVTPTSLHAKEDDTTEELDKSSVKTSTRREGSAEEEPTSPYRAVAIPESEVSIVRLQREEQQEEDDTKARVGSEETTVVEMPSYPPSATKGEKASKAVRSEEEGGDFEYYEGGWRAWGNVVGAWVSRSTPNAGGTKADYCSLTSSCSSLPSAVSHLIRGLLVLLIIFHTDTNAFGVYQSYYKLYVFPSHPASDISWIGSIQLAFFFSLALVAGPLFDKVGYRSGFSTPGNSQGLGAPCDARRSLESAPFGL